MGNSKLELRLTHYVARPPEKGSWVEAPYYTKLGEEPNYNLGNDPSPSLTEKEMERRVDARAVRKLTEPLVMSLSESLWVTPDGEFFIADCVDPIKDEKKRKIA